MIVVDVIVAVALIALGLIGAGAYFGQLAEQRRIREHMFADTRAGDDVREIYGLHLEFTTPVGRGETARAVSQWREYGNV